MASIPFSIRLPSALVDLINALAQKSGVSAPEAMRAAIELSVRGNEYRLLVGASLKEPSNVLKRARAYLRQGSSDLAPQDYSALMYFWHRAYMSGEGYANPSYIAALLDVIAELADELNMVGADGSLHSVRSSLGLLDEHTVWEGVERLKVEFANNPSIGWAEFLTRPLETMADDVKFLDRTKLPQIFDKALDKVLPVAVRGAEAAVDGEIIDWDMKALLPSAENFRLNELSITLLAHPLSIVISEGHHCYPFSSESVLGIAAGINNRAFDSMKTTSGDALSQLTCFRRAELHVARFEQTFVLHESMGYRLQLSNLEFEELITNLEMLFRKPGWVWLLKRHRDLRGDI